jgi:hypothetical protein
MQFCFKGVCIDKQQYRFSREYSGRKQRAAIVQMDCGVSEPQITTPYSEMQIVSPYFYGLGVLSRIWRSLTRVLAVWHKQIRINLLPTFLLFRLLQPAGDCWAYSCQIR